MGEAALSTASSAGEELSDWDDDFGGTSEDESGSPGEEAEEAEDDDDYEEAEGYSEDNSDAPSASDEDDAVVEDAIVSSLQGVIPHKSEGESSGGVREKRPVGQPLRMTDLSFRITQIVLSNKKERGAEPLVPHGLAAQRASSVEDELDSILRHQMGGPAEGQDSGSPPYHAEYPRAASASSSRPSLGEEEAEEEEYGDGMDAFLERTLSGKKRNRTGVRGRPKKQDYGFGRSTTHVLPPTVAKLMGAANGAYVGRRYGEATEHLLEVVRLAPHAVEAYETLGMIMEETGAIDRAVSYYVIAAHLGRERGSPDLWQKLAKLTLQLARFDEALYYLKRVVQMRGARPEHFWMRSRLLVEQRNEPRQAIWTFRRMLASAAVQGAASDGGRDGARAADEEAEYIGLFRRVALLGYRLDMLDVTAALFKAVLGTAIEDALVGSRHFPPLALLIYVIDLLLDVHLKDYEGAAALIESIAVPWVAQYGRLVGGDRGRGTAAMASTTLSTSYFLASEHDRRMDALDSLPVPLRLRYYICCIHLHRALPPVQAIIALASPAVAYERTARLVMAERSLFDVQLARHGASANVADCCLALLSLGRALLARADAANAIAIAGYLMEDPVSGAVNVAVLIGDAYRLISGGEEMAIATYEAVLHDAPERQDVRIALCDLYRQCGRISDASAILAAPPTGGAAPPVLDAARKEALGSGHGSSQDGIFEGLFSVSEFPALLPLSNCSGEEGGGSSALLGPIFSYGQGPRGLGGDGIESRSSAYSSASSSLTASGTPLGHGGRRRRRRRRRHRRMGSKYGDERDGCSGGVLSAAQIAVIRDDVERIDYFYALGDASSLQSVRQLAQPLIEDLAANPLISSSGPPVGSRGVGGMDSEAASPSVDYAFGADALAASARDGRGATVSVLSGVAVPTWFSLICKYAICEATVGDSERALRTVRLFIGKSIFKNDLAMATTLRLLSLGIASRIEGRRAHALLNGARWLLRTWPFAQVTSAIAHRTLVTEQAVQANGATTSTPYSIPFVRFLDRQVERHPSAPPVLFLFLAINLASERYDAALRASMAILAIDGENDVALLATAVAILHQAVKRTCKSPATFQMRAITLLFQYYKKHAAASDGSDEEGKRGGDGTVAKGNAAYNVGRAFHMISMYDLATRYYRIAIACGSAYQMQAAFNMHLILLHLGNHDAARKVLLENICV